MQTKKYKMSFTAGGLFYSEAVTAVELYFNLKDWTAVRSEILAKNILKSRIHSSLVRTSRELLQRFQVLTPDQLDLFYGGCRSEQNQILWLATCKQYEFIYEFAVEVIRDKFQKLNLDVSYLDFDSFFNKKAEWNEDLDKTTELTRKKLRQVLFRMMTDAEILSKQNKILPLILSPKVADVIIHDNIQYLSIYPIREGEIRKYKAHGR